MSANCPAIAENRKKQLNDIRNFYKPIDRDEMNEHNRKYASLKKEKDAKIAADRAKQRAEIEEWNKNLQYKPSMEQTDEDNYFKRKMEENEKAVKEKQQTLSNYSRMVREMYWPKVSVKK